MFSKNEAVAASDFDPGEFAHGWQHLASSVKETRHKEDVVAAKLGRAHTALWNSQQGPFAGTHLTALPTLPELVCQFGIRSGFVYLIVDTANIYHVMSLGGGTK